MEDAQQTWNIRPINHNSVYHAWPNESFSNGQMKSLFHHSALNLFSLHWTLQCLYATLSNVFLHELRRLKVHFHVIYHIFGEYKKNWFWVPAMCLWGSEFSLSSHTPPSEGLCFHFSPFIFVISSPFLPRIRNLIIVTKKKKQQKMKENPLTFIGELLALCD